MLSINSRINNLVFLPSVIRSSILGVLIIFVGVGTSAMLIGIPLIAVGAWFIYDAFREGYNVANDYLLGNDPASEVTATDIDLLSNGFKLRIATDPNVEETYIYAAWAENPFGGFDGSFGASGGVSPATAR